MNLLVADVGLGKTIEAGLVIQELLRQLREHQRLALWGHGRNFQMARASRLGDGVKRLLSRRVHWWFACNALSAEVVRELRFPAERITDVQKAIAHPSPSGSGCRRPHPRSR